MKINLITETGNLSIVPESEFDLDYLKRNFKEHRHTEITANPFYVDNYQLCNVALILPEEK